MTNARVENVQAGSASAKKIATARAALSARSRYLVKTNAKSDGRRNLVLAATRGINTGCGLSLVRVNKQARSVHHLPADQLFEQSVFRINLNRDRNFAGAYCRRR